MTKDDGINIRCQRIGRHRPGHALIHDHNTRTHANGPVVAISYMILIMTRDPFRKSTGDAKHFHLEFVLSQVNSGTCSPSIQLDFSAIVASPALEAVPGRIIRQLCSAAGSFATGGSNALAELSLASVSAAFASFVQGQSAPHRCVFNCTPDRWRSYSRSSRSGSCRRPFRFWSWPFRRCLSGSS